MTEDEWLTSTYPGGIPEPMLQFLEESSTGTDRKLRLFAAATCRRIWHLLGDERSRTAVDTAEQFADGLATSDRLRDAAEAATLATHGPFGGTASGQSGRELHAAYAACWCAESAIEIFAVSACDRAFGASVCDPDDLEEAEGKAQAHFLRDIFGNPFQPAPVIDPDWLRWGGGIVKTLAEAAYQERLLPSGELDPARLAVLADALEDAGCDNAAILAHLRSDGPRVRGCHVIDSLTGRK